MKHFNSYSESILESRIIQLFNEGYLCSSSDFLEKLRSISSKSQIAEVLYQTFSDNVYVTKLNQNYIDVTDFDDKVSFIDNDTYSTMVNDGDHSNPYVAKGRASIKIGRLVTALISHIDLIKRLLPNVTQKDIEDFVNLYKSTKVDNSRKFELVEGVDIAYWYKSHNYSSTRGTLGGSCMKGVPSSFFSIYVNNTSCQLLIYTDGDNKLRGRALVWKLNESPCDAKYFMDRVYTNNDSDMILFKKYAEENGWLYKYSMNSDTYEGLLFLYKSKYIFGKISVKIEEGEFSNYPFLDTLSYLNGSKSEISNIGFINGKVLSSTDGELPDCNSCGGTGIEMCWNCRNKGTQPCQRCNSYEIRNSYNKNPIGKLKIGDKLINCPNCDGSGKVQCTSCEGKKRKSCTSCVGIEDAFINIIINKEVNNDIIDKYYNIVKPLYDASKNES